MGRGWRDYPNVGMCRGLSARILILLQTPFVHLVVKQIHDRREFIQVGAVTQSCLWVLSGSTRDSLTTQIVTRGRQLTKVVFWAAFLGTGEPLPLPLLDLGVNTQFQGFLSQIAERIHRISRVPSYRANVEFLAVLEHQAILSDQAELVGETHPPSSLPWFAIYPT